MKLEISDYYNCEELPKEIELISLMMFVVEKVEKIYYQEVQNEES